MSLSSIFLALFLLLFGLVSLGLRFEYSAPMIGVLAIIAGVLLFCRK